MEDTLAVWQVHGFISSLLVIACLLWLRLCWMCFHLCWMVTLPLFTLMQRLSIMLMQNKLTNTYMHTSQALVLLFILLYWSPICKYCHVFKWRGKNIRMWIWGYMRSCFISCNYLHRIAVCRFDHENNWIKLITCPAEYYTSAQQSQILTELIVICLWLLF